MVSGSIMKRSILIINHQIARTNISHRMNHRFSHTFSETTEDTYAYLIVK